MIEVSIPTDFPPMTGTMIVACLCVVVASGAHDGVPYTIYDRGLA